MKKLEIRELPTFLDDGSLVQPEPTCPMIPFESVEVTAAGAFAACVATLPGMLPAVLSYGHASAISVGPWNACPPRTIC
jgi:hypothetical protein